MLLNPSFWPAPIHAQPVYKISCREFCRSGIQVQRMQQDYHCFLYYSCCWGEWFQCRCMILTKNIERLQAGWSSRFSHIHFALLPWVQSDFNYDLWSCELHCYWPVELLFLSELKCPMIDTVGLQKSAASTADVYLFIQTAVDSSHSRITWRIHTRNHSFSVVACLRNVEWKLCGMAAGPLKQSNRIM